MKICRQCINCQVAIPDPECGYTCSEDHWDYFGGEVTGKASTCPYYKIDEEYLLSHAKTIIEKIQIKRFIRKNKKNAK